MRKLKLYFFVLILFALPAICWAANLDALKVDFLRGNYRRVILEAMAQAGGFNIQGTDELNYLLGLSYLKEERLEQAQDCFRRILSNPASRLKEQASLASADTYLIKRQFKEAEDIYNTLLENNPHTVLKPAILFRLSQSAYRRGDQQKSDEYSIRLKRDFPLSLELIPGKGMPESQASLSRPGDLSVQVGFFTKSSNAVNFKNKLAALGYPAFVEGSKEGYRVKVGRFKTQTETLDAERKLSSEGFPTKLCP